MACRQHQPKVTLGPAYPSQTERRNSPTLVNVAYNLPLIWDGRAKGLYIVPVLFAYTPFLAGDFWLALWIFGYGSIAVYALAGAIEGFMEAPLSWPERALLAALGVFLLWPTPDLWNLLGLAAFVLLFASHLWRCRRSKPGTA